MKVNELMIGDWVLFAGSKYQIRKEDFSANYVFEPIQLTSEILEKNSFKKENGEYWNIGKNQYGNTMYLNEVSYGYIVCTKCFDSDEYVYLYDCKYVHELQHYFKDCKIEKEIKL